MSVRIADRAFAPELEMAELNAGLDGEGAVVSFVGFARPTTTEGAGLSRLVLEHHPRMTVGSLETIATAALERFEISDVRIVHRTGSIAPGEAIVFAAAMAQHRRAAFEATDYMMDRLKTEAMFWKREDGPSGSFWIEPRDDDREALGRWSE